MKPDLLYLVLSRYEPSELQSRDVWHYWSKKNRGCKGCGALGPRFYPRPLDVEFVRRPRGLVCSAAPTWVYREAYLNLVLPHLADAVVGHCYLGSGSARKVIPEYRSFYSGPGEQIIMRGSASVRYRICEVCGIVRTEGWDPGPQYFLSHQLSDRLAYADQGDLIWLTEELVDRIDWAQFRDAEFFPHPVFDRPIDGKRLPGDPDWDRLPPPSPLDGPPSPLFRLELRYEEPALYPAPIRADPVWLKSAKGRQLCQTCGMIDRRHWPEPLHAVVRWRPRWAEDTLRAPLMHVQGTGIWIFRKELLRQLGSQLDGFSLGSITLYDGTNLPDYATCYARPAFTCYRSGAPVVTCERCGATRSEKGRGPEYALRSEVSPAAKDVLGAYQDWEGRLYVTTTGVAPALRHAAYEGLSLDSIPLRHKPPRVTKPDR
jgi:hypothetical protein